MAKQNSYSAAPQFNWAESMDRAYSGVQKVIEERKGQRARNRQINELGGRAIDKKAKSSLTNLDSYNQKITAAAFKAKNAKIKKYEGLLGGDFGSQEWVTYSNNLQDSWDHIASFSKNFNANLTKFAEDENGSIVQGFNALQYAGAANLIDTDINFTDNGTGYWGDVPAAQLNNPQAMFHAKINLSTVIKDRVEELGGFKIASERSGIATEQGFTAFKQNDLDFNQYMESLYAELLTDPNNAASVLGDNGYYNGEPYFTYSADDLDGDGNFKVGSEFEGKDIEGGILIKRSEDGMSNIAVLTDNQMADAKMLIDNQTARAMGMQFTPEYTSSKRTTPPNELRKQNAAIENFKAVVAILEGDADRFNNPGDGITDAKFVGKDIVYKDNGVEKTVDLEGLSNEEKENALYSYYPSGTERDLPGVAEARKLYNRRGLTYTDEYGDVTGEFESGSAYDLTDDKGKGVKLMAMAKVPQMRIVKQGEEKMENVLPTFASAGELEAYISERSENIRKVGGKFYAYLQNLKTGQMVNYPGKYGRTVYEDEDRIGFKDANVSGKPLDSYVKDVLTTQVLKLPNGKRPLKGQKGVNFNITNKGEVQLSYTNKEGDKVTLSASPRTDSNWMQTFLNEFTESYDPNINNNQAP
jgi:hypothetical protein